MQNYVKIYLDHFDFKTESEVMCEACTKPAVDVHHIYGRGEGRDVITNLMALCRKCHDKATTGKVTKSEMQLIHNFFLSGQRKQFLK
jgi:5-methylcytosine-specific restriction endonuclease McrA